MEVRAPRQDGPADLEAAARSEIRLDERLPSASSLPRLLHEAPSARLREFGGEGQLATVALRGGSPAQTLILLDGVPLPAPAGGGVDLSLVPVEFIERIEVLRGAAAADLGAGALGGALNLITRVPRENFLLKLSGGSFGTFRGAAATGFRSGRTRFLLAASGQSSEGDFPFLDDRGTAENPKDDRQRLRQNNDSRALAWLARAQSDLGTGGVWAITHLGTIQERGVAGLLGFVSRRARERSFLELLDLRAHHEAGPALVALSIRQLATARRFSDPLGELTGVPVESRQETNGLDVGASVVLPFLRHRARFSLTGATLSLRDRAYGDPVRRTVSLGASGRLSFFDDALRLEPGALLTLASDAGSEVSASGGASLRLGHGWSVFANAGRTVRLPEFAELYLRSGFAEGNPDLFSEEALSAEAGLALRRRGLLLSLGGYFLHYRNLIVYEPAAAFRYKPQNAGRVDVAGAEAELRLRPVRGLEAQLVYSLLLSCDRSGRPNRDGNRVPGWPVHQGMFRLAWDRQRLLAEAAAFWIGENFVNQANTKSLPQRFLLDLSAGVRPSPDTSLMVEVRNLLDQRTQDVRGFPVSGISVFLTLSLKGGEP
ncbi:MAG: TonB-dependent receptor [Myxococcales bacterium]|nr:TonB-dependent receptor [Myxococcales bacterium]